MTSETDHPRQRTVAELLAEHGDVAATGRRRRRRAADGPDDVESSVGFTTGGPSFDYAPPSVPDRRILRQPVPPDEPLRRGPVTPPPAYDRPRDIPTERMPRVPDLGPRRFPEPSAPATPPGPSATVPPMPAAAPASPPGQQTRTMRAPVEPPAPARPAGPPPADPWARARPERRPDDDGGPPTQAGVPPLDDDYDEPYGRRGAAAAPGGPRGRRAGYDDDLDGYEDEFDSGYDSDLDSDDFDDSELEAARVADDDEAEETSGSRTRRRRAADEEAPATQSWGAVVAQWIIGAIGGALLWVAFRFLWRDLMVVAIFAAILVTAGLVYVVRNLLRTTDTRTTAFAVGVGLLLTVSPVLLILLGK